MYRMIRDEKVAKALGYNVEAIRKLIIDFRAQRLRRLGASDDNWEKIERRMRNNDLYYAYGSANPQLIKVVHLWVREYNGKDQLLHDRWSRPDQQVPLQEGRAVRELLSGFHGVLLRGGHRRRLPRRARAGL